MADLLEEFLNSRDVNSIARVLNSSAPTKQQLDEAIRTAVREGCVALISQLVAAGASLRTSNPESSWPLLHLAVEHDQLDAIAELVRLGADVDELDSVSWTPLHMAVDVAGDAAWQTNTEPDLRTVELLLRLGADPSVEDEQARTPRKLAEEYAQPRIVQILSPK